MIVSRNVCVVSYSQRIIAPLRKNPIGDIGIVLNIIFENAKEDQKNNPLFKLMVEQLTNKQKLLPQQSFQEQQMMFFEIMQDVVTDENNRDQALPISTKHCLGFTDTDVVFLTKPIGEFIDNFATAIVVTNEEFDRLLKLYPNGKKCHDNNDTVIVFNVPKETEITPKTHDNEGNIIPHQWTNPIKPVEFKLVAGVSDDGTIHLEDGVDSNSQGARLCQIFSDVMKKKY